MNLQEKLLKLKEPIDPKLIKQREGWRDRNGNTHMVDYIEWHVACDLLDAYAPEWTHKIVNLTEIGEVAVVVVAIVIDGVSREGVGTGASNSELGLKKAEHDALKRAAVKFGIGRELYKKESDIIERTAPEVNTRPSNPVATGLQDLVTAKQLGMMRAIGRSLGIDADEECRAEMNVEMDSLSKKGASSFIQHLQAMQNGGQKPAQQQARPATRSAPVQPRLPERQINEEFDDDIPWERS